MSEAALARRRERVTTGVPGLDVVTHGGLVRGAVYMIHGRPGCGKTTLANQIGFHQAAQGGRVVYVTLLSETHERMIFNLEPFAFFERSYIPSRVSYLSGFPILEEGGLKALSEMLRRETRAARATMLVVDDLLAVEESATTSRQLKKFVHELQALAELVGCTVLLLTSASSRPVVPEHTMVDGVLELVDRRVDKRAERELEITKFRGSSYLKGGHAFQINDTGVTVFPRLEGLLREPSSDDERRMERLPSGIEQLDRALNGGLMYGSSTVVFGPTGVGKTSLGLHFLAGCSEEEPGLHFGFFETPERLLMKARTLGLELEAKKNAGTLSFCWYPPTERILDQLGNELVETVRKRGIKRLLVDGIDGFVKAAADADRVTQFMSALSNELRVLGVTTMYTHELKDLLSMQITLPVQGISSVCENMLLLRFLERRQQLVRTLVVVKLRDSGYDRTIRELLITDRGVELGAPTQSGTIGSSGVDAALPRSPVARITRLLRRGSGR